MIGHHARLRDVTGQSYACTRANHARYSPVQAIFCGSWKDNLLRVIVEKKSDRWKVSSI